MRPSSITFNFVGALSEFGKLGIVSIADSVEHASEAFERTVEPCSTGKRVGRHSSSTGYKDARQPYVGQS
jgi:hypothetical protein